MYSISAACILADVRFHNGIPNTQKRIINTDQVGLYNLFLFKIPIFPDSI